MVLDQGQSTASGGGCHVPYLRVLIAFMTISCAACCYISRQNLSIAFLAMTTSGKSKENFGPTYDWDGTRVLGAFFFTYVACQIPGARIAQTSGPKWVLFTAGFGSAVLSAVSPWAASIESWSFFGDWAKRETGDWSFFGVRLILGICQSAIFPACYIILTNWLPLTERRIALPIMNASAYLGSIIAMKTSGIFCQSESYTWEWSFYFPAVVCSIWSLIWIFLATNKPDQHQCLSKKELDHIESNRGDAKSSTSKLDWNKLFASRQVWGSIVAFLASNYSFSLMLTMLPIYLESIHGLTTERNVDINVNMNIIYIISAPIIGFSSSYLIKNSTFGLSRIAVRRIFQSIAVWGQVACFLTIIRLGTDIDKVEYILYLQILSYSFVNGGEVHLPTEISAEFGGTIYAISNCVGSCCGFIIPYVLDWIVKTKSDINEWNTFLYVAAGVSFIGNSIFVLIAGNQPEDLSMGSPKESLSNGTFKSIGSVQGVRKNHVTTADTHIELTEMEKLNKSNRDYSSITMSNNINGNCRKSEELPNERRIS